MKGHMQDGKFHPHTEYKKGTRKSRDQQAKEQGVKIEGGIRKSRNSLEDIPVGRAVELGNYINELYEKDDKDFTSLSEQDQQNLISAGEQLSGMNPFIGNTSSIEANSVKKLLRLKPTKSNKEFLRRAHQEGTEEEGMEGGRRLVGGGRRHLGPRREEGARGHVDILWSLRRWEKQQGRGAHSLAIVLHRARRDSGQDR